MAANIDTMLYVKETPWHGLGHYYEKPPRSSQEIIDGAQLNWEVAAMPMKTDLHDHVLNYNAIYRKDDNSVLGVVNSHNIQVVQNTDTFNTFDSMLGVSLEVDTAASLDRGKTVFGCFKLSDEFKVLDDEVQHYFVVMNDHLKPDGKVTVLNTPVRVVCQNTLSAALDNNIYKLRVPISSDVSINSKLINNIMTSATNSILALQHKAEFMVKQKITRDHVEKILDELFPIMKVSEDGESRANLAMEMQRDTFLSDCMGADNLSNYRGTTWQVYNALADFSQHYFKNTDKGYDLNYRMKLLPGMGTDTPANLVTKFLRMSDKLIA